MFRRLSSMSSRGNAGGDAPSGFRDWGGYESRGEPVLRVHIKEAKNITKKDFFGRSDPYAVVSLHHHTSDAIRGLREIGRKGKTSSKRFTINPQWDEAIAIHWHDQGPVPPAPSTFILIRLFDKDRFSSDDFLGQIVFDLSLLPIARNESFRERADITVNLERRNAMDRVRGSVTVQLSYDVEEGSAPAPPPTDTPPEPGAPLARQASVSQDGEPIPPGWESRTDQLGRTFYIDHNTRRTTWERPTTSTSLLTPAPNVAAEMERLREREERMRDDAGMVESEHESESEPETPVPSTPITPSTPPAPSAPSAPALSPVGSSETPLPPGWTSGTTSSGRTFYVNHNTRSTTWEDPRGAAAPGAGSPLAGTATAPSAPSQVPAAAAAPARTRGNGPNIARNDLDMQLGPLPPHWEMRVTPRGRKFFVDHRTKLTQWEDPRTGEKPKDEAVIAYSRDYKVKLQTFRGMLTPQSGKVDLKVSRKSLFESSFQAVMKHPATAYTKRLYVIFDGEQGYDYGGLSREWFYLLSHEMFNPYYGLFEYSAIDAYTLQVNPNSGVNPNHLEYFEFIGRVVGLAVFHGRLLDAFFVRPFYKAILGEKITLADMESVDQEFFNSMNWVLENDPEPLCLTFTTDEDEFGNVTTIALKEGGADIDVTNENKHEYVDLIISWRFEKRVKDQMASFMKGFEAFVPRSKISIFDAKELELLVGGVSQINVDDWRQNTEYKNYRPTDMGIQWFWRCVLEMDLEMRARLLQFVTGTSRVPMNGFSELYGSDGPRKFKIERTGVATALPRAHTCFNRLDLPPYPSYEVLKDKLTKAVELTDGFSGVD